MDLRSTTFFATLILLFAATTVPVATFFINKPPDVVITGRHSTPMNLIETNEISIILSCEIEAPLLNSVYKWQYRNQSVLRWTKCGSWKTMNFTTEDTFTFYRCQVEALLGNKTVTLVSKPTLVLRQDDNNGTVITNQVSVSSSNRTTYFVIGFIAVVEFVVICGLLCVFVGNNLGLRSYKLTLRKGHKKDHEVGNGFLEDGNEERSCPPAKMRRRKTTDSVDEDGYILPIQMPQTRVCETPKCKTDSTYIELRAEDEADDEEDTYETPATDPLYENVATLLRADHNDTKNE